MIRKMFSSLGTHSADDVGGRLRIICVSGVFLLLKLLDRKLNLFPSVLDPTWGAVILCAFPIIGQTVVNLLQRTGKRGLLVSAALMISLMSGEVFVTGIMALIIQIGYFLEEIIAARADSVINRFVRTMPQAARVVSVKGQRYVSLADVRIGDMIRILPGETVPVDGVIADKQTAVILKPLTGGDVREEKSVGELAVSGSIDCSGAFDIRAVKSDFDSTAQQLIRIVRYSDVSNANSMRMAYRRVFWVAGAACIAALMTWMLTGETARAVAVLAAVCPFSAVTAVSTAFTAAINRAAEHGVLVRRGDALESLAKSDTVSFSCLSDCLNEEEQGLTDKLRFYGINSVMDHDRADIVLVGEHLEEPYFITDLAKRFASVIKAAFIVHAVFNITVLLLSAAGLVGPFAASLFHSAGFIIAALGGAVLPGRSHSSKPKSSPRSWPKRSPLQEKA